ncbi:LuxR C-terminal-related transcriptional regulator [Endozoicomonas sp. YOMI1]|uniref:LuxR C-terminal-related transcriptional regulator n=1 Tax=Endozoicomonas sp. YOMI1 TaxID=2828739 RepID=UPI002147337A|nr:LuxR C-terminal-related transcriptional regulator [Endozoicomonas sp. YOMI1]
MTPQTTILVLSEQKTMQSRVLLSLLSEHFNIVQVTLDDFSRSPLPEFSVAIIDQTNISQDVLQKTLTSLSNFQTQPTLALLNATSLPDKNLLRSFPNLKGVFQDSDDLRTLIRGLHILESGGYYMPAAMVSQLIGFGQRGKPTKTVTPKNFLTEREKQILGLLRTGATNTEIADHLFLSENTIKTHIYNTYRKLNVRNRAEAIEWSNLTQFQDSQEETV